MSRMTEDKCYQVYGILQFVFIVAPIIAGFDKFFNILVNWSNYLSPLSTHVAVCFKHSAL